MTISHPSQLVNNRTNNRMLACSYQRKRAKRSETNKTSKSKNRILHLLLRTNSQNIHF